VAVTTAPASGSRGGLAKAGLIGLAGSIINGAAAFGVVVAITRGLDSTAASGAVFTTMAVFNIAFIVCTLGAEVAVVRAVARNDTNERSIVNAALWPSLAFSIVVAVALAAARGTIASAIGGEHHNDLTAALLVAVPFIPFATATSVLTAVTRGRGTMMPTVMIERISRPSTQLILLGFAAVLDAGPTITTLAWTVTFGIAALPAAAWFAKTKPVGDDRNHAHVAPNYWRFAAPQALTTVFQVLLRWADIVLVAALTDTATAAVYTAASRMLLTGNFLNLAIVQSISPMISNALARGASDEASDLLKTGTGWLVAAVWPGYLLLIVFGGVALDLFGAGYAVGGTALAILAAAMLIASAVGPIEAVLLMSGGSLTSLGNNAAAVLVNVVANVVLVPKMGIEGAAIAWALGLLITNIAPLIQVRQRLGFDPSGRGLTVAATVAVITVLLPSLVIRQVLDVGLLDLVIVAAVTGALHVVVLSRSRAVLHLDELVGALRSGNRQSKAS